MQNRKLIANNLLVALLILASAPPVVAADNFTMGTQAYTAKNYAEAEKCLTATVKAFPGYWPGHYYLGHTYLALGRREDARKEYEACLAGQPPPGQDIIDVCKKTIVALGGTLPEGSAVPALADSKPSDAKPADATKAAEAATGEKKEEGESYREKEHRLLVERLRKQSAEKVASIREELKQALATGDATSSRWYIDKETGGCITHMNDDDRAAIEREYQARITKEEEATERKIADLH